MKSLFYVGLITLAFVACDEVTSDVDSYEKTGDGFGSYALGDAMGGGVSSGGSGENGNPNNQIVAGQITAGEWNDLENWSFWLNLPQQDTLRDLDTYWGYNLNRRISVVVKNHDRRGLVDIKVELLDEANSVVWVSKTDHLGKVEIWPSLLKNIGQTEDLKIRIGENIFQSVKEFSEGVNEFLVEMPTAAPSQPTIDIAFVVDATGSMADELEYLKVELVDVIDSVKETRSKLVINLGSVFYRDQGDEYVTRVSGFSTDISKTVSFIQKQSADGGGDFPEAVHSALDKAVNELQWSSRATSRILFLVLDAPPHNEPQIVSQLHSLVQKANAKGIKIIPVTASGIDRETEFLMRYFAIATNGTYVFITNHSGIGNEHIEPTVGEYEVEYLNHLMVRLINKYLTTE